MGIRKTKSYFNRNTTNREELWKTIKSYWTVNPHSNEDRELLELPLNRALTKNEIKKAFKIQAKLYHPDYSSDEQRFSLLVAAKERLLREIEV